MAREIDRQTDRQKDRHNEADLRHRLQQHSNLEAERATFCMRREGGVETGLASRRGRATERRKKKVIKKKEWKKEHKGRENERENCVS